MLDDVINAIGHVVVILGVFALGYGITKLDQWLKQTGSKERNDDN